MNDDLVHIKTLFDKKLPPVELKEATFLDIINQQSKENTISSIYAYFLNHNNSPEISQLFLDSLWDILSIEAIPLENYYVYNNTFAKGKTLG